MVKYLSDEWMEQAAAALAEVEVDPAEAVCVQYEVTGSGDGKRHYTLEAGSGSLRLVPGRNKDAPVTFTLDYDTAVAIACGEVSAQVAFMQGRLKLGGDVRVLIDGAATLAHVDASLEELRASTEF